MFVYRTWPVWLLSSIRRVAALCCMTAVFLNFSSSFAHKGHDHDDSARTALAAATWPRVIAHSELYEVVGILKGERLSIYLDHFATNEPVVDATVQVTIGDGEAIDAEPTGNGTYTVSSLRLSGTGSVEVLFNIAAQSGDDLLVGTITLPKASLPGPVGTSGSALSKLATAIPSPVRNPLVLTLVAFGLGVLFGHLHRSGRLVLATVTGAGAAGVLIVLVAVALGHEEHEHPTSPAAPAQGGTMSDAPRRLPDGAAFVAKPTQRLLAVRTIATKPETVRPAVNLIGRVIGDPNRTGVVQSIHGGRVILLAGGLPRIGQSVSKGEVLAQIEPYLPLADRTTILEKTGEIEQLIAVAEARIRRLRPLAERGVVPQSQLIDAETELEGLRLRRETIRNTRMEQELLRAPTDGVVAVAKVVPGQVVQPQDIIFQIVDPKGLWVEALVYGQVDPASLTDAMAVTTSGQTMPLRYQGFSRALQQQAAIVHFAIVEPPSNLGIGQPVTVVATSGAPTTGLVVPRDAVVRSDNGEAIVWLHVDPERFEARPVRTLPLDATRLIVAAGAKEGDRIVVRGADLINQIR